MDFTVTIRCMGKEKDFEVPIQLGQVMSAFNIDDSNKEYRITDVQFPMKISNPTISKVNYLAERLSQLPKYLKSLSVINAIKLETGWSAEEFLDSLDEIMFVEGDNEEELGRFFKEVVEGEDVEPYFDYKKYGHNILTQNLYVTVDGGYILIFD